ncbi:phospholipase A1 4-like [Brevipalpus obovatus]|uniref:phospholipase A1 4-like n=1 Tax=Brevipalpus obovatus TaxID=246614 RepID=UPI003D9DE829
MMVSDTATLIQSTFIVLGVLVNGFHLSPISDLESDINLSSDHFAAVLLDDPSWSSKESSTTRRVFVDGPNKADISYPEQKTLFARSNSSLFKNGKSSRPPELNSCVKPVCYDDSIGCFEPWTLSLAYGLISYSVCPEDPATVGTSFHVYYQKNRHESSDPKRIGPTDKIAFVIHGYGNSHNDSRFIDLKNKLLPFVNVVIMVDYTRGGGPGIPSRTGLDDFFQAAANVQVVGRQIANYIHNLKETNRVDPKKIHLIGYSLGSHAAHFAAEHARGKAMKFGRITGLDPPGVLLFESGKRLFKGDAIFVDVIHTTEFDDSAWLDYYYARSGKVGLPIDLGHADFYPNGGGAKEQPGCEGKPWCSHNYALDMFQASIQQCKFPAVKCRSWQQYKNGLCHLGRSETVRLGYWAQKDQASGRYFSSTKKFVNGRC